MSHRYPTNQEIRQRIENIKDKQYQMAFKYQYEVLGRISEVAGKYMPTNDQHRVIEVEGEEFVMFIAKTAKRKGLLRPCARPLDTKYDPWAKEVYDYIESSDKYPFSFHENVSTSKTYAMTKAYDVYAGLYWSMPDYTRAVPREYTKDMVKHERWGDEGYKEYLVVFPDGERTWTRDEKVAHIGVKVEPRWRRMTSHVLRKVSAQSLRFDYGLDDVDVAYFGGWSISPNAGVSTALNKHYMYMDLHEADIVIPQLEKIARRYAKKLLVPYAALV